MPDQQATKAKQELAQNMIGSIFNNVALTEGQRQAVQQTVIQFFDSITLADANGQPIEQEEPAQQEAN